MNFTTIIFDLDGTLADTLEDLAASMNHALAQQGLPTHPVEPYRYFVGDGLRNMALRALGEGNEQYVDETMRRMREHYAEHWMDKTTLYDGIAEMLDSLTARGLTRCVFSNKPDDFTKLMVGKLLGRWRFDAVRGALPGVPVKPDPTGAFAMLNELNVTPAEVLYVGDTWTDMATAANAKFTSVGVLWGFRDRKELEDHHADHIIARPMELVSILDNLKPGT